MSKKTKAVVQNKKTEDEVKYGQLIIMTWTLLEISNTWELYSVINPINGGTEKKSKLEF